MWGRVSVCSHKRWVAVGECDLGVSEDESWGTAATGRRSRVIARSTSLCLPMTVSGFRAWRGWPVRKARVLKGERGGTNRERAGWRICVP